jgi:hypothetical protein
MRRNRSIERRIREARAILANASDDDLQSILAPRGIDPEFIADGTALVDRLEAAYEEQQSAYDDKLDASARLDQAADTARSQFVAFARITRFLYDDPGVKRRLRVDEAVGNARSEWMPQAKRFYGTLILSETLLEKLSRFAITREDVEAGLRDLDDVEALEMERDRLQGVAESATETRDAVLDEVQDYFRLFRELATLALTEAGRPQLLEGLGVRVRAIG